MISVIIRSCSQMQIRETPHRSHHKFVEYYDIRAAEAALRALNRSDIAGKRIKLEPSRPGGARRYFPSTKKFVFTAHIFALSSPFIQLFLGWQLSLYDNLRTDINNVFNI